MSDQWSAGDKEAARFLAKTPPGAQERAAAVVAGWECGCCPECEKKMCEHSVSYIADALLTRRPAPEKP